MGWDLRNTNVCCFSDESLPGSTCVCVLESDTDNKLVLYKHWQTRCCATCLQEHKLILMDNI